MYNSHPSTLLLNRLWWKQLKAVYQILRWTNPIWQYMTTVKMSLIDNCRKYEFTHMWIGLSFVPIPMVLGISCSHISLRKTDCNQQRRGLSSFVTMFLVFLLFRFLGILLVPQNMYKLSAHALSKSKTVSIILIFPESFDHFDVPYMFLTLYLQLGLLGVCCISKHLFLQREIAIVEDLLFTFFIRSNSSCMVWAFMDEWCKTLNLDFQASLSCGIESQSWHMEES